MATNHNQAASDLLVDIANLAVLAEQKAHQVRPQDVGFLKGLVLDLAELAGQTKDLAHGNNGIYRLGDLTTSFDYLCLEYIAAAHPEALAAHANRVSHSNQASLGNAGLFSHTASLTTKDHPKAPTTTTTAQAPVPPTPSPFKV